MEQFYFRYILYIIGFLVLFSCHNHSVSTSEEADILTKEELIEVNRQLVKKDAEEIESFVKSKNWDMSVSESGLWYMVIKNGNGEMTLASKEVKIEYSIKLMDGTICYNSNKLGAKSFMIGSGNVEKGLEEGILMMRQGSKMRFIMPPHLAHGLIGDGNRIPARAILIYEVELLKIK